MPTDLYYFYESDLDKTNIEDFYDSLPSHLQSQFARCNRTKIFWGNVLQGYRGPPHMCNNGSGDSSSLHPSHGIQEIRYRWGVRKDLNFIPIVGTSFFLGGKLRHKTQSYQTEWVSLYFDSKTGECLSHDKDEAAEKLNSKGCRLFEERKYSEAAEYHNNAYQTCSSGYRSEQTFKNNAKNAESELRAISLNSEGDHLFSEGKYSEAIDKYREAYDISKVGSQYQTYKRNRDKAQAEIDAKNLNSEADNLFQQGKYSEAQNKYQEAFNLSQIEKEKIIYSANRDKSKVEADATILNTEGCRLYEQGNYVEAERKFQQAYNTTRISNRKQTYMDNRSIAQREMNASQLCSEGVNLFGQRKYSDAHRKFQDARNKSKVAAQIQKFQGLENEAKIELDAIQLNRQGDDLYSQCRYDEALNNYRQAYNTSRVSAEKQIYNGNIVKAQAEINAKNLNAEGDNLFQQNKYSEAQSKYQEASNLTQIDKEKIIYAANKNKAQAIINKLIMIDTLWNHAWDAESDIENDRGVEAEALFAKISSESKNGLKIFPNSSKLKQYETLVTLKIEGNELFNQGIQLQLNGITLFEKALELKRRANHESANIKFEEARNKFLNAQAKFERGKQLDQRFSSCIEFVQEQIETVTDSIKVNEQFIMSHDLHELDVKTASDDNATTHSYENHEAEKQNNYSAHI